MGATRNLVLVLLALCCAPAVSVRGAESNSVDKLQLNLFGASTLEGAKAVYPQVMLEVIEEDAKEPGFVPSLGPLVQKDLSDGLTQALLSAGIEVADSIDISESDAPLNLNITVFVRVVGKPDSPAYVISVNTEVLQSVRLSQNSSIRTLARTWPMTPMGLTTRNLLLLNPQTIELGIKKEVAYQLGFFIKDYMAANPKDKIEQRKETEERIVGTPPPQPNYGQMITGIVLHVPIEGGFYGLLADNGTKYDPTNLPEVYKRNGLRVRFQVNPKKGMASIHMWGTIVEIVKIEKI